MNYEEIRNEEKDKLNKNPAKQYIQITKTGLFR